MHLEWKQRTIPSTLGHHWAQHALLFYVSLRKSLICLWATDVSLTSQITIVVFLAGVPYILLNPFLSFFFLLFWTVFINLKEKNNFLIFNSSFYNYQIYVKKQKNNITESFSPTCFCLDYMAVTEHGTNTVISRDNKRLKRNYWGFVKPKFD